MDIDDILHPDERHRRNARVHETVIAILDQLVARIDQELERPEELRDDQQRPPGH